MLMYLCYKWFGVFGGIFAYILAMQTVKSVLKRVYHLEIMNKNDELFFQDDERSYGNIVSHLFFEKFTEEEGRVFFE